MTDDSGGERRLIFNLSTHATKNPEETVKLLEKKEALTHLGADISGLSQDLEGQLDSSAADSAAAELSGQRSGSKDRILAGHDEVGLVEVFGQVGGGHVPPVEAFRASPGLGQENGDIFEAASVGGQVEAMRNRGQEILKDEIEFVNVFESCPKRVSQMKKS